MVVTDNQCNMKKALIGLFLFSLYISPMLYGLIINSEYWMSFGVFWLLFGWIPVLLLGEFFGEL
jgi:hypothetical protein